MTLQRTNQGFSQKTILILGILAGISLFGYALIYIIRMPAVSPGAFVPRTLEGSQGDFSFGLFQSLFVLGFAFAFLPVCIMFTIQRYRDNPHAMVLACSLMCLALVIEVFNGLPILGNYLYPEPLTHVSPEVLLYLNQTASIRYLSFDVAGFTIIYVSLLVFAAVYWKSHRVLRYLALASVIVFLASVPLLWINGTASVICLTISVLCISPVPVLFGKMAVE